MATSPGSISPSTSTVRARRPKWLGVFFGLSRSGARLSDGAQPPRTEDELQRPAQGAVEDSARSVFSGLVRIEKTAFGASAFETNRNLVLSPDAKANSIPNLEILCDDVICGHGSSVGPLEDEHFSTTCRVGASPRSVQSACWFEASSTRCSTSCPCGECRDSLSEILERRFLDAGGRRDDRPSSGELRRPRGRGGPAHRV